MDSATVEATLATEPAPMPEHLFEIHQDLDLDQSDSSRRFVNS